MGDQSFIRMEIIIFDIPIFLSGYKNNCCFKCFGVMFRPSLNHSSRTQSNWKKRLKIFDMGTKNAVQIIGLISFCCRHRRIECEKLSPLSFVFVIWALCRPNPTIHTKFEIFCWWYGTLNDSTLPGLVGYSQLYRLLFNAAPLYEHISHFSQSLQILNYNHKYKARYRARFPDTWNIFLQILA